MIITAVVIIFLFCVWLAIVTDPEPVITLTLNAGSWFKRGDLLNCGPEDSPVEAVILKTPKATKIAGMDAYNVEIILLGQNASLLRMLWVILIMKLQYPEKKPQPTYSI